MINEVIRLRDEKYGNVTLTTYILDDPMEKDARKPAVLVCPGGGYAWCSPREAEPIAMQYAKAGFHTFVLNYTLAPNRYPMSLEDASNAIKLIRKNAEKWRVEEDHIAVIGFSAGGHLAASIGLLWNQEPIKTEDKSNRPNAVILSYAVITSGEFANKGSFVNLCGDDEELKEKLSLENCVTKDAPPMFIWHTFNDTCVPVENSLLLATALKKEDIPFEMHIYPNGPHGLSTVTPDVDINPETVSKNAPGWVELSVNWLMEVFDK